MIEYLRLNARSFIFTASAVPAAVAATLAAVRICRSEEGRELMARTLANARYLHAGLAGLGFDVVSPTRLADGSEVVTTVVPVVVGEDWKAALLWRALYDAGVFVNVAVHPAVGPAGALLRTSVMASHDEQTLDLALERFAAVKRAFEAEHGPLPGGGRRRRDPSRGRPRPAPASPYTEKTRSERMCSCCDIAVTWPVF